MVVRFIPPTLDVAELRRAVLDSDLLGISLVPRPGSTQFSQEGLGTRLVGHPLTTNAEGANQHLIHPGLSLQLSQEVYYTHRYRILLGKRPPPIFGVPSDLGGGGGYPQKRPPHPR